MASALPLHRWQLMRSAACRLRAISLLRAQHVRSQVALFASRAPLNSGGVPHVGRTADARRPSTPALPSIDLSASANASSNTSHPYPPPGCDMSLALDFILGRMRIVASNSGSFADERLTELRSLLAFSVQRSLPLTLIQRIFATIVETVATNGAVFEGADVANVMSALQSAKQSQAVLLLFQQATPVHRVLANDSAWPRLIEFALRAAATRRQERLVLSFLRRLFPWTKSSSSSALQSPIAADTVSVIIAMLQAAASAHSSSARPVSSANVDAFEASHLHSTRFQSHPHRDIAAIIDLLCRVGVNLPSSLLTPLVRVCLLINQPGLCRRVLALSAALPTSSAPAVVESIGGCVSIGAPRVASASADFAPRPQLSSDTALSLLMSLSRDGELRAASLWFEMLVAPSLACDSSSSSSSTLALLPTLASEQAAQAALMLFAGFSSAAGPADASHPPMPPLLESAWRLVERVSLPIALQPIVLEAAFSAAARAGARSVAVRVLGVMQRLASAESAKAADYHDARDISATPPMRPHMDALDELLLPILNRAAWMADCSDGDSSTAAPASTGAADFAYVRSVLASLECLARVNGTRSTPLHAASNEDLRRDGATDRTAPEHFSHWCSDELRIALQRHGLVS